ncbi:MAG: type IV pilus twitching motility protein PilT [Planctomycetota bacterium]
METMLEFDELLKRMVRERASDLFLKTGSPPTFRIDGRIRFMQADPLSAQQLELYVAHMLKSWSGESLLERAEIDVAYELPTVGRFRANLYRQMGGYACALRHIPSAVQTFEELELPSEQLRGLSALNRGLILVTGVAGAGKSTTLAAMVNYINDRSNKHVVTIEDPIEYVFRDKRSIVSQREIGVDTDNFAQALKHVVRQSPDVILIGEMRDAETMQAALQAAETGHLVLSTLHTVNAQQAVERIINYFPPHQHQLIRLQLSMVLEGIVCQRLIPRRDGRGRVPAVEILMRSPTVRDILYEGRTTDLYKAIQDGEYFGSQTFNQSLRRLYEAERITLEDAMGAADNPDELKLEIRGIIRGNRTSDYDYDY